MWFRLIWIVAKCPGPIADNYDWYRNKECLDRGSNALLFDKVVRTLIHSVTDAARPLI